LLLVIPTFLGITLVCFTLIQFVPGGPVEQALMQMKGLGVGEAARGTGESATVSPELRRQLKEHFGFDRPIHERYLKWLIVNRLGMLTESYKFPNKTAWQMIRSRLPVSLIFGVTGFLLSYVICIPLGIAKALRHGGTFDLMSSVIVFIGYAIPVVAFGMVIKMLFAGTVDHFWDVFAHAGFESDNFDSLSLAGKLQDRVTHMFLPVLCYVVGSFAVLTILMKNSLLEQVGQDYIRTVLAKGGSYSHAIWRHALRNSLIPIATGLGGILMVLFGGSIIIEQIFEIPGMGRLSLEAIISRDYPVFMGTLSITSVLILLGNIISDFCYVLIDPRINFQQ